VLAQRMMPWPRSGSVAIASTPGAHPRVVELTKGRLELAHQDVGTVYELVAPLEKPVSDLARLAHSLPQLLGERRAGENVGANTVSQIAMTIQAQICADAQRVGSKLPLAEALGARDAFGDGVVQTIDVKENMFLRAQTAGPPAIDMRQGIAVPFQGIGR